jgi:hypothetical protein
MNRNWIALPGVCLFALAVTAGEPGFRAQFVGGTLSSIPAKTNAHLDLTGSDAMVFRSGGTELRIVYQKINALEYGQAVNRRIAEAVLLSPIFLLSKSRKHFVTVEYVDSGGKQQALVFRVEKGDIRPVLAALEARSGRRIEFQDDEARKAGK